MSAGVTLCHFWSLTHCSLIVPVPFPPSWGLVVFPAGLLRVHWPEFPSFLNKTPYISGQTPAAIPRLGLQAQEPEDITLVSFQPLHKGQRPTLLESRRKQALTKELLLPAH